MESMYDYFEECEDEKDGEGYEPGTGEVQSVLFLKKEWTKERAEEWLRQHDYKSDIIEKDRFFRAQQMANDGEKYDYRIKHIGEYISLIFQFPKK